MLGTLAKKIFGSSNDRRLKTYRPKVAAINALESEVQALTDEQLAQRTVAFREQLAAGKTLDDILVPPSPRCARQRSACSASAISTFS